MLLMGIENGDASMGKRHTSAAVPVRWPTGAGEGDAGLGKGCGVVALREAWSTGANRAGEENSGGNKRPHSGCT